MDFAPYMVQVRHIHAQVDAKVFAQQKTKAAKEEAKAIQMAKQAAGMKDIKSFFGKPASRQAIN